MDRGVKIAIQFEHVQLLVILELVSAVLGNFDYCAKDLRGTVADGEFQIIDHGSYFS
jgi:hypothetical protein